MWGLGKGLCNTVLCPTARYNGEVGDIVVGRITEVRSRAGPGEQSQERGLTAQRANRAMACIRSSATRRLRDVILALYSVLVRP